MKKVSYVIFYAIIIFLPFLTLLGNIFEFKTEIIGSQIFWLMHWYEIVLLIMLVWGIIRAIKEKKIFNLSFLISALLLIYSILFVLFSDNHGRSLEGFRFTILPLIFFIVASLINFTKEEKNKLINLYLTVSLIVAFWALLERIFPPKYWNNIGLIDPNAVFGWGWHFAGGFLQSASVLGGPNQLASYLLPALFLAVYRTQNADNSRIASKTVYCLLSTVILLAIILSQSRSAIIGLVIGFLIYVYIINKNKLIKYGFSAFLLLSTIVLAFLYQTNINFRTVATHGGQTGHQTAFSDSMIEIRTRAMDNPAKLIFGSGLGTAGPLALKYGDGFISESWYLQLVLEIGLIGLILWFGLIVVVLRELLKAKKNGLFLGLLAVSVTAIFLHTWADNPALSYTLFILLGLTVKKN